MNAFFEKAIEILQLEKNFTERELKKAYYKNAIKYHPDKNNGCKEKEEHFKKILDAWRTQLREEVDRTVTHMQDEAANFPDPVDRAAQEEEFSL